MILELESIPASIPESFQEHVLPACLFENPYRLVVSWKMQLIRSERFVTLLGDLTRLEQRLERGVQFNSPSEVREAIDALKEDCAKLSLLSSIKQLERIESTCRAASRALPVKEFSDLFSELRRRVDEDMEESVFYQVEADQVRICFTRSRIDNLTQLSMKTPEEFFGTEVVSSFPSATQDIHETCRSLACGRNTGAVFHLMRALELALTPLGAVFGVSLAHTNWGTAIDQIESNIRKMHNDLAWTIQPDWRDKQELYSQAASHFRVLKDAWRNFTAHARGTYDADQATEIMMGVRGFMQKLATHLHE